MTTSCQLRYFPEASDRYWGLAILQKKEEKKRTLLFLSGKFGETELRWRIIDK